ncbi:MAG: choice-of-anchor L domain-containing protein [Flavobacteriales bacterium]|nr:hypothetical protein [Flavobacteriales bacterium]MCC6578348.1 choice-of-anchor L domain-containing protein [Flavobacteriales bacterium]NUQ14572.1 gliding motility-associated C-terminal domain-containing protein [Flavobacteriales bacterium]
MNNKTFGGLMMVALLMPTLASAQITVDNSQTPEQLVQNVLLGAGITVSNVTFNGQPGNLVNDQIGSFDGTNSNVGIAQGLVMCSGSIPEVVGPNDDESFSVGPASPAFTGDIDLETISQQAVNDKAVLEFDFVPAGDSLVFRFVFGSEEYNEYVCSSFNDVFGFFLSGPGINGPFSNNAANIALVPGTNVPIGINTVNNGTPGSFGDAANCAAVDPGWQNNSIHYFDNAGGLTVQYDGFTVVLTAYALVQCGQTYHIKLAIADAFDSAFDSGVFLEGGSFSSPNAIDLEVVTASADGTMTEGCTDATLTITRPGNEDDLDVSVVVSGTATNGVDYPSIPVTIVIPDGQSSVSFPLSAFEDGVAEGMEEIILTATYVNACGDTSVSTAAVPILEYVPMQLFAEDLALQCEDDSVMLTASATGGFGDLTITWATGDQGTTTWVPGMQNGTYQVTVTDACARTVTDQVNVDSGCQIVIPNVFSPNGDGDNDTFYIDGIQGTNNKVRIFNRWGQVVFEANNYRNTWDGRNVPDGTYFYEVVVEGGEGPFTGHLTILNN